MKIKILSIKIKSEYNRLAKLLISGLCKETEDWISKECKLKVTREKSEIESQMEKGVIYTRVKERWLGKKRKRAILIIKNPQNETIKSPKSL